MTASTPALRQQIRGSTLLVVGRLIGATSNFAGQIILVRYLAQADYGALAYALSMVTFCQALSMFGMRSSVSRFVPLHHERGEHEKLLGVLVLALGTTAVLGIALAASFAWWPALISRLISGDEAASRLMVVMAYMIPLQALDILLINVLASFGKTRKIFFRKFVVVPVLKFSIVLVLVVSGRGVMVMAYGHLVATVIALLVTAWGVTRLLWREIGIRRLNRSLGGVSLRQFYGYSGSILVHEMVHPLMHSVNVFLLGYFYGPVEVAIYTVVLPLARLNRIVTDNIQVLYLPLASRLWARGDRPGLNELYWQTAIWTMMASFPIFGVTFAAAGPLTSLLYGVEYGASSIILMLLVAGYYFEIALGCNGPTLRMLGRVRFLLGVDTVTVILNVIGNLVLIRYFGAFGAGVCTAGTMMTQGLLRQLVIRRVPDLTAFDPRCVVFYCFVAMWSLAMLAFDRVASPSIYGALLAVAIASGLLFLLTRRRLRIEDVFPELTRMPLIRMLVT